MSKKARKTRKKKETKVQKGAMRNSAKTHKNSTLEENPEK